MAKGIAIEVEGQVLQTEQIKIGVSGTVRNIVGIYVGVAGNVRQIWPRIYKTTYADMAEFTHDVLAQYTHEEIASNNKFAEDLVEVNMSNLELYKMNKLDLRVTDTLDNQGLRKGDQ